MQRHISLWPELTNNQTLEMIAVDIDFTSKGLDWTRTGERRGCE